MTNKKILKKAIEKAHKSGLQHYSFYDEWSINNSAEIRGVIFSHDFAKAFWGEEDLCLDCLKCLDECQDFEWDDTRITKIYTYGHQEAWQYHIQQMVLEEEPIKYLEQFLV